MIHVRHLAALASVTALALAVGCGGDGGSESSGTNGFGGEASSSTGHGGATSSSAALHGSTSSTASGEGGHADPCVGVQCDPGQICDPVTGTCNDATCADLHCSATERCDALPSGGAVCTDISCSSDVACPADQFCNGTICVDDACVPGALTCSGGEVHACKPNGSGDATLVTCGSQTHFTSACVDQGGGVAGCTCEDDWDCPADQVCSVGVCVGSGKAPTCTLPPAPFTSNLPATEIHWGGTDTTHQDATGSPFAFSSQVCTTPMVANLDDDNGDGRVDELDFPEIVFMTYCGSDHDGNAVVRAIHGGGPNKGKDYFAVCGDNVWHEGDDIAMPCDCTTATGNSLAVLAVGDLDGDGLPEVVYPTEGKGLIILDSKGDIVARTADGALTGPSPAPVIANLDHAGLAEIIVGNQVFTLGHDAAGKLEFVDAFAGNLMTGRNGAGTIACTGDVAGDEDLEVIAGSSVYALPKPPAGVTKRSECATGATDDFCLGKMTVVWDGLAKNPTLASAQRDGFCAIADVLGADQVAAPGPTNPLDGKPEVILVATGHVLVFNGQDGTLRRDLALDTVGGGAPNVDDFDGDGFPEIGTAFGQKYQVVDLQDTAAACPAWPTSLSGDTTPAPQGNPARTPGGACTADGDCATGAVCNKTSGTCACLHNGWSRVTQDKSSAVTGSSVFDFNGDGAAEVVYNDECYFRVYSGLNGDVLYRVNSPSVTRIENPVVADVDNDGNAEIVFASNNAESRSCPEGINYPNGITVLGDPTDTWVSARRIYNEHAYHVTNVTEGGQIPQFEPPSWKTYNGRRYNTFRSNPRSFGVAPDLTIGGAQVSSPNRACGQLTNQVTITVEVDNIGDLRVGPGVGLTFYGTWSGPTLEEPLYANMLMTPLTSTLTTSLEPGGSVLVSVSYDATNNTRMTLPDSIRVVVDEADVARECIETNNDLTFAVDPGDALADLTIDVGAAAGCPTDVTAKVTNIGSAPASNVVVRYYAGDPNAGGVALHDETIPGPIAGNGGSATLHASITNLPAGGATTIYAVVDPDNSIEECNDGNNKDKADNAVTCGPH